MMTASTKRDKQYLIIHDREFKFTKILHRNNAGKLTLDVKIRPRFGPGYPRAHYFNNGEISYGYASTQPGGGYQERNVSLHDIKIKFIKILLKC